MVDFLAHARTVVEQRECSTRSADITISFQLNERQCTHLWRLIRVVYNFLSSSRLPYPHEKRHKYVPNVFREFCILVTRANEIGQQFSSVQSWLQAALFQGSHRSAFKEIILDLQACVSLFYESTGHRIPVDAAGTIWRPDVDMDDDFQADAVSFRNRLADLVAQCALGEEEKTLADYLIERENSTLRIDGQDGNLPQFYSVKCGRYPTSGEHIAHGAFGAVYKVNWLGIICAKKHFNGPESEGSMTEFLKEVNILAKLNHPHIVKLLCTSHVQPEVSFVMEIMPMSLSDFIKQRWRNHEGFVPSAAFDIILQIARGMEYLHDQGIAHRDLKPSNILVTPSPIDKLRDMGYADVKVADFGLAKMKVNDLTKPTREKMGTTNWRAPEACFAHEAIDWKKADAYSFAMTCSEIFTGQTPFNSGPLTELCARIKSGERPILPPRCPKLLVSLLEDCWHTSPSVRPSFAQIREALTSVKGDTLKLQWNDRFPYRVYKQRGGRMYGVVDPNLRRFQSVSNDFPGLLLEIR